MTLNVFTIITLFSVFLTAFLSLFFFVTKKGFSNENKTLAVLLLVFDLQIIFSFLTSTSTYIYFLEWHKLAFLIRQTSFLIGPLIYFYVNSFLKKQSSLDYRNLFHFIPFAAVIIYLLFYYSKTNRFIIWDTNIDLYDTILILAHNFAYIILSVLSMKAMNLSFRDFYKSIRISSPNSWLQVLILGFVAIWVVNLNSFAVFMIVRKPEWCAYTASIYALTAFLFLNLLMFFLLSNPDMYYVSTKYKNTKLKEEEKKDYLQRLSSFMETNKPFFNPEISLESLAIEISMNPRILSQIINETFNKTFKGYILEFRIKESMQILADSRYNHLTILEILYKVGFNTKSTFNNQFKIYTNLTPQEYRSKFMSEKKAVLQYS
jgi:AraC-like DNA-binding protein